MLALLQELRSSQKMSEFEKMQASQAGAIVYALLFQPDPTDETLGRKPLALSPEKRLMLRILEDALDVITKPQRTICSKVVKETLDWINDDDEMWIFSFNNICDCIGADPGRVRRAMLAQVGSKQKKQEKRKTRLTGIAGSAINKVA